MPDYEFTSFPIPADEVDIDQLVTDMTNAQDDIINLSTGKVDKSTTINGYNLSENRTIYAQDIPSKNLLPINFNSTTYNDVTYTVNGDGSISTSGTASGDSIFNICGPGIGALDFLGQGDFVLSGCPQGGSGTTYDLQIQVNGSYPSPDTGSGASFSRTSTSGGERVRIFIASGVNASGMVWRPMIRPASIEDDTYVPYAKTNAELSKPIYVQDVPSRNLLPNVATSKTQNNVTFTVNSDGSVTVSTSGSASAVTYLDLSATVGSIAKSWDGMILSGCPTGGNGNYNITILQRSPDVTFAVDTGSGATISSSSATASSTVEMYIRIASGASISTPITFYPMIRPSSAPSGYVPYAKTNVELSKPIYVQDIPSKNLLNPLIDTAPTGITYTVSTDGKITFSGSVSSNVTWKIGVLNSSYSGQNMILSGCATGGGTSGYSLRVYNGGTVVATDNGDGTAFTAASDTTVYIRLATGATYSNVTFKPMVRLASITDDTYVPYAKTNIELTGTVGSLLKVLKLSDTIGALSAGDSGFRTLTGTIENGYKAIKINTIEYGHPGTSKFVLCGAGLSGTTGNISCYCPYYAYGATQANSTDFSVYVLCIKDEISTS